MSSASFPGSWGTRQAFTNAFTKIRTSFLEKMATTGMPCFHSLGFMLPKTRLTRSCALMKT